jgi:hypothetical protein
LVLWLAYRERYYTDYNACVIKADDFADTGAGNKRSKMLYSRDKYVYLDKSRTSMKWLINKPYLSALMNGVRIVCRN